MVNRSLQWTGRSIVKGVAQGPAMVSRTAFSFLGDTDIRTGKVVGEMSDLRGQIIAGTVLVIPGTRGSAGAWRFLYQLKVHNTHPVAIITDELPDPSVVQGAILAGIPIISNLAIDFRASVINGQMLAVDGNSGIVKCIKPDYS